MTLSTLLLALAPTTGAVTVELAPEARVRGTELELADVAAVRGADPELVARIGAHHVGYAPAPGFSRLLHDWTLARDLAGAFPGVKVALAGAPSCRVWPEVTHVAGADLFAAASAALAERLEGLDAEATPLGEPGAVEVPAGDAPPRLVARAELRTAAEGEWKVPVEVHVDGVPYRTAWVAFDVALWREVPVLARDVVKGETLALTDLGTRRVRVGDQDTRDALDPRRLVGAVAVRALRSGEPVGPRDVRREHLVRRGDALHLEVRKGAVVARSTCVALDAGYLGDRIRVRAGSADREVTGVVRGRDRVVVDLDGAGGAL